MISMTYDQRRETFRFVSRKIRFVFAVFGPPRARNETKGNTSCPQGAARSIASRRRGKTGTGFRHLELWSVLRGRFAAPQNEVFGARPKERKKLRKGAVKPLKSLARVNLCAGGLSTDRPLRFRIFALESRNEFRHRLHRFNRANPLPASPDVAPRLRF
jgi:hypothetical protein